MNPKKQMDLYPPNGLSPRELEALQYVADGKISSDIGKIMGVKKATVSTYIRRCVEKLNAETRSHAVAIAFRLGWIN